METVHSYCFAGARDIFHIRLRCCTVYAICDSLSLISCASHFLQLRLESILRLPKSVFSFDCTSCGDSIVYRRSLNVGLPIIAHSNSLRIRHVPIVFQLAPLAWIWHAVYVLRHSISAFFLFHLFLFLQVSSSLRKECWHLYHFLLWLWTHASFSLDLNCCCRCQFSIFVFAVLLVCFGFLECAVLTRIIGWILQMTLY
jgi:hypothetical protein